MNQTEKAQRFAELHVKGAPLLLYNAWDAGSAKSIVAAGSTATARTSRSLWSNRSWGGSWRPSMRRSRWTMKVATARTTANWPTISRALSIRESSASTSRSGSSKALGSA